MAVRSQNIHITPGSLMHQSYSQDQCTEKFTCNYGVNTSYRDLIEKGELNITSLDEKGEVRAVELSGHPFFVGTLYQPQISSTSEQPHPLIISYLSAIERL